jgi:ATP-dependent DNA helicase RecQ
MHVELLDVGTGAGAVVDDLLVRYAEQASARVERIVGFAESTRCRHAQVAEHFGELLEPPCGACDVCSPREPRVEPKPAASLPDDVGSAIVAAVQALRWPLGRRSLIAMLRGSVSAPPSARASASFGVLAAATEAEVKRWVRALEDAGALVEVETEDGFRVLNAVPGRPLPAIGPKPGAAVDDALLSRLRSWRRERSRADGVPAYVVLHDAMLRDLAATRPTTRHELAAVKGFGPARIERYGDEVLELVGDVT